VTAGRGVVEGTLHPSYAYFSNPTRAGKLGRGQVATFQEHHGASDLGYRIRLD